MLYELVEGTTDSIQFQLLENTSPIDVSNTTVTILVEDRLGNTVANPGTVTVIDSTNGKVQFTASNVNVFLAVNSPYFVRWKLTHNIDGGIGYVPSTGRDVWNFFGV